MAKLGNRCDLSTSIVVARPIQTCWDMYIDNSLVAQWSPSVSQVDCSAELLNINVSRKSHIVISGRNGYTVEQCTIFEPLKRIEFNVIEETFGFSHMLKSYGFGISLEIDAENTIVAMHTHYVPKKIFTVVMNANTTQRKLMHLMSVTLNGFKRYAETGR